jgi:putative heme-binding domain-containing protein
MTTRIAVCLAFFVASLVRAQAPKEEDDPAVEQRAFVLPPGFEIQLVASEPTVINPVQINFDPQGRLWVLCIPRYPQLLPGQDPADFVTVLDDIGASGKAKKAIVFAESLTVPTGMAPGDGGVYVGQADKLLHLKDTKGAGKADQRRVLFAGFGTQDTHHTLNSFRWGPDGSLYFNQGIYIKSDVETPYGLRRYWGGGIWQLRPDRLKLDVYDRSIAGTNTWGHIFDAWGRSFCTTAWPDGIYQVLPDSPLNTSNEKNVVPPLPLTRVADGRHCGATFVTGRHFPDDWQGNLVSGSFASQLIYRYDFSETGAKIAGKQKAPLVTSKHRKFRPVDVQMGPDGALYIADWYDEIIQHNQIDFRDPRRDHSHGRIWRVVAKDRPLVTPPKLVGVSAADVLEQLKSPELAARFQAKRALAERDAKEVKLALESWVAGLEPKDKDASHHLLEALWTSQAIDHVNANLLSRVLRADEPRARAAAARVAGAWADRLPDPLTILTPAVNDADPRVRLEAILAISRVPAARSIEVALLALDQPSDALIDFAALKAAIVLQPSWYPEFQKGKLTFAGRPRHLAFALAAIKANDALPQLAKLLQSGQIPEENRGDVYALLAAQGDAKLQRYAWEWLPSARPTVAASILDALELAARERRSRPEGDVNQLIDLINGADAEVSAAASRLAGAWKFEPARTALNKLAVADRPLNQRAAIAALVALGGPATIETLERLSGGDSAYSLRVQALAGLAALDAKLAAPRAGELLRQPTAEGDPSDLYLAFLGRSGGAGILAEALQQNRPSADAAKIGIRVLNSQGVPTSPLHKILQDSADIGGPSRKPSPADVARLLALVRASGDPARGELVFRRASLGCQQCHAIGGAGGRVGPDLSGIGASSQLEYLLESVLMPDKVIREGYNTAHLVLNDGKAISGIVVRETPQSLVLRTPTIDELAVAKKDIDERSGGGSLMPQGLASLVTDAELADLVKFLSEVGKLGPFAVSHVPMARRWSVLTKFPARIAGLDAALLGKTLRGDPRLTWTPAFSKVSGELPLTDIKGGDTTFVACQLDVAIGGLVNLKLNSAEGLTLWLDGAPIEATDRISAQFSRGTHTLDVRIEHRKRRAPGLSCEIVEGPTSTAQARFVGGK